MSYRITRKSADLFYRIEIQQNLTFVWHIKYPAILGKMIPFRPQVTQTASLTGSFLTGEGGGIATLKESWSGIRSSQFHKQL